MTVPTVVWPGWPHAPAPLAAIFATRRSGPMRVVDDAGRAVPWRATTGVRELLRIGWQRLLGGGLGLLAALGTPRRAPAVAAASAGDGPVVLVLPVLPDLSHTFVYREVLAILRQRPSWRVVVLARNDLAPVHTEARELLDRAVFLRRDGVTRNAVRVLRWLLRARGRSLFGLYRAEPAGSVHDLLDKLALRDPRHPGNAFVLADLLAPLRPRHVHVYASTWPANVAMGAAHLLGVPFSISSYVDFEFAYSHKMLAAKIARASFFRVVTRHCREQLLGMREAGASGADRVPVVYLGLDLAAWQQEAPLPGHRVLVSAARLVPKKGLHVVPPALAALRARGLPCRWRVIGDGPELTALRSACAQHGVTDLVEFLGPRDNDCVRTELLAADLALLPCVVAPDGERDGIPIFLVEAMALGVPAVTTPVSGIPELVRDGDTGFLARPGDSRSLADVLQRALGDPAAARAIGARGRHAVHTTLDVDGMARELIAHIER